MPDPPENSPATTAKPLETPNYEEFLNNAEDCTVFREVVDELTSERDRQPVDPTYAKVSQDWSILANQVVGQESFVQDEG